MELADINFTSYATLAALSYTIYCFSIVIYRLLFHPLSSFPGPRLAACSLWYEFYYDAVLEGQWVWKIKQMHEKYGPIVRINPHELHIRDADFYNEIYAPFGASSKRDKYAWWCGMAGAPGSIFATVGHEHHRIRRAPLDDFFSKRAVRELEPLIREKVQRLSDRFANVAKQSEIIRIDCAFMALTMDVICTYCFGEDRAYVDRDDLGREWKEVINGAWQKGALMRAFPFMADLMRRFPRCIANRIDADMGHFLAWQDSVKEAVEPIMAHGEQNEKSEGKRTIFHTLRDSSLPAEERTLRRLCDEGEIFTGAGSETTAKTLTTILYYLITNADCLERLKQELRHAMPDPTILASWTTLEKLPYLSAVIHEGLRLSYGITTRLPRVAPKPLQYNEWTIPPNTPISSTPYFVLTDPVIFKEPDEFRPERWLESDNLQRYQVAFNKGSRACIGVNLAYAEMFLACGALFQRFKFELHETDFRNMEMVHDFFVAAPAKEHRGVKAKVLFDP